MRGENSFWQHGQGRCLGISPLRAIHFLRETDPGGAPVEMTAPRFGISQEPQPERRSLRNVLPNVRILHASELQGGAVENDFPSVQDHADGITIADVSAV